MTKSKILAPMNLLYKLSPKLELKLLYKLKTGYTLNLDNPVTYNEKLQWLKLYDKNELMPKCCDKFLVREYVRSCGCGEILNEVLWEGFNPVEIPFDGLPDQFVIKVSHGSTINIICKNKKEVNRDKTVGSLNKWLKIKFLPCYGEWFYGIEKSRIVVEKYLKDEESKILPEYKFFCFHGEPKLIHINTWKDEKTGVDLYDPEFKLMKNDQSGHENAAETQISKLDNLDKMLEYARKLSKDFLHVRVDFYNVNGKIIFGKLAFTKGAGYSRITPPSFDIEMGSWLELPKKVGERCWIIKK